MAAVKEAAIELEQNMEMATCTDNAAMAYRLGLLEACRLINEENSRYTAGPVAEALNACWRVVFDAATYLRETDRGA